MYNRYINSDGFEILPPEDAIPGREETVPPQAEPLAEEAANAEETKPAQKGLGALKNLLGNNIKLPDFNADTILLLVLVYFLVADPDDKISDTVLIIAALFLLGL